MRQAGPVARMAETRNVVMILIRTYRKRSLGGLGPATDTCLEPEEYSPHASIAFHEDQF
jgi:hypothetical protein